MRILALTILLFTSISTHASLIALWSGEGNANDSSGNAHHGTLNGGVGFTAGHSGQAFDLDGVNDWVGINNVDFAQAGGGAWSVSAWFSTTDPVAGSRDMFSAAVGTSNSPEILVGLNQSVTPGRVRFFSGGNSTYSADAYNDGVFHHFAAIQNGPLMALFIDGVIVSTLSASYTASTALNIALGRLTYNNSARYFKGQLDEVAVYSHALSAAEVSALADTGNTSVPAPSALMLVLAGLFGIARRQIKETS